MKISKHQFPAIVALMKKAYPEYTGRKFFIEVFDRPFSTASYWDGGSRDYFRFVRPDGKVIGMPETAPWTQHQEENREATLVPGLACVRNSIFCGCDCGLTIILHPNDMPKMIGSTVQVRRGSGVGNE
jgi:hypothetical protein